MLRVQLLLLVQRTFRSVLALAFAGTPSLPGVIDTPEHAGYHNKCAEAYDQLRLQLRTHSECTKAIANEAPHTIVPTIANRRE